MSDITYKYKTQPESAVDIYNRIKAESAYRKQQKAQQEAERRALAYAQQQEAAALQEQAQQKAQEEQKNKGGFLGGLGYAGEKIGLGLLRGIEGFWDWAAGGIADLFGADEWAEKQVSNDWINYNHADEWRNPGAGWKFVGDVAGGVGQMLPSIAVTAATGGAGAPAALSSALGTGVFMAGAAGNSVADAYRTTGELGAKEWLYGTGSGILEGAIEKVSGGIGGTKLGTVLGKKVANSTAGKLATSFVGEGLEEVASDLIDPTLRRVTGVDPNAQVDVSQLPNTFLVGGTAGAVLGGASRVANAKRAGGFNNLNAAEAAQEIRSAQEKGNSLQAKGKLTESWAKTLGEKQAETAVKLSERLKKMTPESRSALIENNNLSYLFNADGSMKEAPKATYNKDAYSYSLQGREDALKYQPTAEALTDTQKAVVRNVEKMSGGKVKTVIAENLTADDGTKANALYKDGVMYIDRNANAAEVEAVHEMTHSLEGTEAYNKYANFIFKEIQSSPELTKRYGEYLARYRTTAEAYSGQTQNMDAQRARYVVQTELVSQYTADMFGNEEFIRRLSKSEPNVAQRLWQWIKDKIKVLTSKGGDRETIAFLQKAEKMYRKALSDSVGGVKLSELQFEDEAETEKVTPAKGEPAEARYLLAKDDDSVYNGKKNGEIENGQERESGLRRVQSRGLDSRATGRSIRGVADLQKEFGGAAGKRISKHIAEVITSPKRIDKYTEEIAREHAKKIGYDLYFAKLIDSKKEYYRQGKYLFATEDITADDFGRILDRFDPVNRNTEAGKTAHISAERWKKFLDLHGDGDVFVAKIPIQDFLDLTADRLAQRDIREQTAPLDVSDLKASDQLYIKIDFKSGKVLDHEGRHRLTALLNAGYQNADVMILAENAEQYQFDKLIVLPQESAGEKPIALFNLVSATDPAYKDFATFQYQKVWDKDIRYSLSIKDSEGNELSKEQREFFKDSKVVDEKGRLLEVYHGTPYREFYKFKGSKLFFFSTEEHFAREYAETKSFENEMDAEARVINTYLNIKNLFDINDQNCEKYLRENINGEIDFGFGGTRYNIDEYISLLKGNYTLRPKWTKEQIKSATFGKAIGQSRTGYNNDVFVGIDNDNNVVYVDNVDGRYLRFVSEKEKAKLLNGEKIDVTYYTAEVWSGYLSQFPNGLTVEQRNKIVGDDKKKGYLFTKHTETISPHKTTQENEYLSNQDNWAYFELSSIRNQKDEIISNIVDLILNGGYDGIKMTEKGVDNFAVANSNQIKLTTNKTPTSDADIRYSLKKEPPKSKTAIETEQVISQISDQLQLDFGASKAEIADLLSVIRGDVQEAFGKKNMREGSYRALYSKYKEKYYQKIRDNRATNQILDAARKARDMLNRKDYVSAGVLENDQMKDFLRAVSGFKRGANISGDIRQKVAALSDIYNENNLLLGGEDMNLLGDFDQDVSDAIALIKVNADSKKALSSEELQALKVISRGLVHLYQNYDKVFRDGKTQTAKELATEAVTRGKKALRYRRKDGFLSSVFGKIGEGLRQITDPTSVARGLDGYDPDGFLTTALDEVKAGEVKAGVAAVDLMLPFEEFFKQNKGYQKRLEKEELTIDSVVRVTPDGEQNAQELKLTVDEAMSLYLTSKRAQANIFESGITVERGERTETYRITEKDIEKLYEQFTETDKKFVEMAHDFFNEHARRLKVETDQALYGYAKVEDTNDYIPIRRDPGMIAKSLGDERGFVNEVANTRNFSFNKTTRKGAKNKGYIGALTDLVTRHATEVSTYYGLAVPLKNFNKVYNRQVTVDGRKTSYRELLKNELWRGGEQYFRKLFNDVQGVRGQQTAADRALRQMRSMYSTYQLGANPKTVLSQTASYVMALTYLDADTLARGGVMKTDVEAMYKYAPITYQRMHDRAVVRAQGLMEKVGKVGNIATKPIQLMDNAVVHKLWNASQLQVEKDMGYQVGTEENLTEAGKLLDKVVRETQSNSLIAERSAMNRSQNFLASSLTMFMSDATKQVSRIADAVGEVRMLRAQLKAGEDVGERYAAAKKKLRKTLTGVLASNLHLALLALFFRWLYDKEEKDKDGNKIGFGASLAKEYASNLFGLIPIVRDIYGYLADDFEVNNYALSMINDLASAAKSMTGLVGDAISGKPLNTQEVMKPLRQMIYAVGQVTGIPVRNVYNFSYGLLTKFSPETAYRTNTLFYSNTGYAKDIKEALEQGNKDMARTIARTEIGLRGASGKAADELARLYIAGESVMPKKTAEQVTIDGEQVPLTNAQMKAFDSAYKAYLPAVEKLMGSSDYRDLDDAGKAKAIGFIEEYYYAQAVESVLKISRLTAKQQATAIIPADKLAVYLAVISSIGSDKDKDGNTITGSRKKKVFAYINKLPISAAQKYVLMGLAGYKNEKGQSQVESLIRSKVKDRNTATALLEASGY